MVNLNSTICCTLTFLAFASVGTMVHNVEGATCIQGLGICSTDCDSRCRSRHPNGQATCDYTVDPPACSCRYVCGASPVNPPPEPKRNCNAGFGLCSANCNNSCCNTKCANKYYNGEGFCNSLGNIYLCQCTYVCQKG